MRYAFFPRLTIGMLAIGCLLVTTAWDSEAKSHRKHRQIPSWYLALNTSVSFVEDSYFTAQSGAASTDGNVQFDTGYGLAGAIGYRPRYTDSLLDNLRFESEVGLIDTDVETQTINGSGTSTIDGDIQAARVMGNLYIDFDATQQIRPYIGGGVGIARLYAEQDEDTVFAYQGMIGLYYTPSSFPVTEFGVGYRFFATENPVFTTPDTGNPVEMEYEAHSLEIGLRAYF